MSLKNLSTFDVAILGNQWWKFMTKSKYIAFVNDLILIDKRSKNGSDK